MYWNRLVDDIINQNVDNYPLRYLPIDESIVEETVRNKRPTHQRIELSDGHYLTQREAECMMLLLQGLTMKRIGEQLDLSPRTVEYYLKRIKVRTGCRTKKDLIQYASNLSFEA